ncbi:lysylphosphatidylglycerol synthase transmembrane domain-containing protein [Rapidithrix thailandica]|uniref:Lysylphosphatidylglycerol synthase transmembrane domain-containing protein n=1 Tax=Rapidithrix thailandica TaxID=413964 RepID=A0AAW9SAH0_9BACT
MDHKNKKIIQSLNPKKILIPILIGVVVVMFMIFSGDGIDFQEVKVHFQKANIYWFLFALVVLFARDLGYIYRIRHLTDKNLSWVSSVYVILLWEFASAVTPSVVGGTAIAVIIMNQENISFGRSLAYVMLTAVLDNLFFVFASLFVLLALPFDIFPNLKEMTALRFDLPLKSIFILSVSLVAVYTFLMSFGLFFQPRAFKWVLIKATNNRFLRRFRSLAAQSGDDVITASAVLKGERWDYWVKAGLSTIFIWSARYFMLNCLIAAFSGVDVWDHLLIFSRQIIMWVIMLISPTPGSTGTAEYTFELFFGEFFEYSGLALAVALFWRLFTYYAYLGVGAITIPRWIQRVFYKDLKKETQTADESENVLKD